MSKKQKADLIVTAGQLITCQSKGLPRTKKELNDLKILSPGSIAVKENKIAAVDKPEKIYSKWKVDSGSKKLEFLNKVAMPGFVDCHTHLVFGGSRVKEFQMRQEGVSYEEIQASIGGIISTVKATREASFEELYKRAKDLIFLMLKHGTTTLETKSGYGLDLDNEIKTLKVTRKLNSDSPVDIVSTFLGAHAVPKEFSNNRSAYVNLIINKMLPLVKKENLAEFADVFCERGAFNLKETEKILKAAKKLGFKLKIHSGEFTNTGGTSLGVDLGAVSCDHLMHVNEKDINKLSKNETLAVLLPGTTFFLGEKKFAPARELIDKGVPIALATDFNAGSCMCFSLQMIISLACLKMGMTVSEAIKASTINAAHAVNKADKIGSIEVGKQADIIILDIDDYKILPYLFGANLVRTVIKKGRIVGSL